MTRPVQAFFVATLFVLSAQEAKAQLLQWTVHEQNSNGETAYAYAISEQLQGGSIHLVNQRAAIWASDGSTYALLDPPAGQGIARSAVNGVSGAHQVGVVAFYIYPVPQLGPWETVHAAMWSGNQSPWVDLHPPGSTGSSARAVHGEVQVGDATFGGQTRAGMWHGSPDSWVSLHPPTATSSSASAVHGAVQGGYARINDRSHAGIWYGSAASWIDLHPAEATSSQVNGVSDTCQVGRAGGRATMWFGSAETRLDLHPPGYDTSELNAVSQNWQAGEVATAFYARASVWQGSSESWTDLHALLPSNYTVSTARGVWSDGTIVRVTGGAYNADTGRHLAILWIGTPCVADFDRNNVREVPDIFAFLSAWFALDPSANVDGVVGIAVSDIFAFLSAWFAGC